ncbi:MAG: hypothetical protein M3405_14470 [Acidobacteriota bacterium]|jgi:hypothetical protein|nr:hypothetical protein [Acidobacteriota bacterium]
MNSVQALNPTGYFPFGYGKSNSESLLKTQDDHVPKQKNESLILEEKNVVKNENSLFPKELVNIFGENGKHRFDEFNSYEEGWYGGKGKKISQGSIFFLKQFAYYLPELKQYRPSLFMTLEGNLSIGFEDRNGKSIEIEFFSNKAEYYLESLEEENSKKLVHISELTNKVRNLLN